MEHDWQRTSPDDVRCANCGYETSFRNADVRAEYQNPRIPDCSPAPAEKKKDAAAPAKKAAAKPAAKATVKPAAKAAAKK